jgi:hypothetical protein
MFIVSIASNAWTGVAATVTGPTRGAYLTAAKACKRGFIDIEKLAPCLTGLVPLTSLLADAIEVARDEHADLSGDAKQELQVMIDTMVEALAVLQGAA